MPLCRVPAMQPEGHRTSVGQELRAAVYSWEFPNSNDNFIVKPNYKPRKHIGHGEQIGNFQSVQVQIDN